LIDNIIKIKGFNKMKKQYFTWLSLSLFSLFVIMVFTASECEGTVEEEINTNIEFSLPEEDSHQGYSRNGDTGLVDIRIIRNDNEQDISLGVSEIPQGLSHSFDHEILLPSGFNSVSTNLNFSNISSLNGDSHAITIYAQAPGQTVYRSFFLTEQYFNVQFSTDTLFIDIGGSGSVGVSFLPINGFDCEVSLDVDVPAAISWNFDNTTLGTIRNNQTATLTLSDLTGIAGIHTINVIGNTNTNNCNFLEKDRASIILNIGLSSLWTDVTPNPAPSTLFDIDGDFAVGENGTILRTSDEGLTWENLSSGTSETLKAVQNNSSIYVAGANGTVLVSASNGNSWQNIGILAAPNIHAIQKVGSNLWAVGDDGAGAVAFLSRDDGNIWVKSNTPYNQSFYQVFLGVTFSDTSNGILVGNLHSSIFRTTDAGENWEIVPVDPLQLEYISGNVACGVVGSIIRTTDGGSTWQTMASGTFGNFTSFSGPVYVGYNNTIVRQEAGSYITEETGILGFSTNLFGVTFNGTYMAVGGTGVGGGVIIKRQPL
jgi:photosystem II stability/assembly factor-like uncharacterized protein